jgi:hypothetical protein
VDVRADSPDDFLKLAKKLREAGSGGKAIRRELTGTFNRMLKPIVTDVQTAVRNVKVRGASGRGAMSRGRFHDAADLRRISKAQAAGKVSRRRKSSRPTGLRSSIARGVRSRVQWSAIKFGVRVYIDTSGLPQSQRKLPRFLDGQGRWRHPVWGHRDRWVDQFGSPYFRTTIKPHEKRLRAEVRRTVDTALRKLR